MKKNDDQFETLISQSIRDDFNEVPKPPNSKEQTWNEISKNLSKKSNRIPPYKPWRVAFAVVVLLLIGSTFSNASSTTAFGWIKEFFTFQEGSTLFISSGSKPVDNSKMKPPSAEEIVVHEAVSKTHSVNVANAKDLASFSLYVPTYLPNGYSESEAIVVCFNDRCDSVTLVYKGKDGHSLTIKQQYFDGAYGTGGGVSNVAETKEKTVHGVKASLIITSHENLKFLKWSKYNVEFSVEGYLSEEDILKVVESLKAK